VKPPLAEARGFHAQPLGHSAPRDASPLFGALDTGKTAGATPSPASRWLAYIFSSDPLWRQEWREDGQRIRSTPLAGTRAAPVQAFAAWIVSRRLSPTKRAIRRASRPGTVIPLRQRLFRVRAIQVAELGKGRLIRPWSYRASGDRQAGWKAASAAPPAAQRMTTIHGGVFHMNSSRKAAAASAKSPALAIPAVQTGL
jgi:hypothetical protein